MNKQDQETFVDFLDKILFIFGEFAGYVLSGVGTGLGIGISLYLIFV